MSELLLIGNPAKRRRTKATKRRSTKKASPAQLRARAKFAAMARSRSKTAKRRSPARKSRAVSSTTRSNPIMAKRRAPKRKSAARRTSRRVRRNPISGRGVSAALMPALKSAALGAAGAIGVDAVYGFAQSYLPLSMQTPNDATGNTNYGYYAAKGAAAFGVAMALKKVIGANKAASVLQGSLTVTLHDLAKGFVTANIPSMTMAKYTGIAPQNLRSMPGGRVVNLPNAGLNQYTGGLSSNMAVREQNRR